MPSAAFSSSVFEIHIVSCFCKMKVSLTLIPFSSSPSLSPALPFFSQASGGVTPSVFCRGRGGAGGDVKGRSQPDWHAVHLSGEGHLHHQPLPDAGGGEEAARR